MPVDETRFGRCDRENNCGHHLHPSTDPELAEKSRPENFVPPVKEQVVQIFPEESIWRPLVERTKTCISPLHLFVSKTLLIPNEHLLKWGVYSDKGSDEEDLTVYVYRNAAGKICNLKWFKYKPDGHRDKNYTAHSLKQPKSLVHPPTPPNLKKISRKNISCVCTVNTFWIRKKRELCAWWKVKRPR